jgi:gamma-glutamylcyclotransferase (GGCT)/AIG2-like uncharacterized protein YtfP
MKDSSPYLFVYGSLRQGFNHAAYAYITQYFDFVGQGKAMGKMYDLGPYPAAIAEGTDFHIVGELYIIRHSDEFDYAIAQLDDYEGVAASYDETSLYTRALTNVQLTDGTVQQAWIYWYTGDVSGFPLVESGDVLAYLKGKKG